MIEVEKGTYIISEDYIKEIFGNIDDICTVNKELVEELKKRLDNPGQREVRSDLNRPDSSTPSTDVGDIFCKFVTQPL